MKVDVITLDAVQNYGSVLQAFATQVFLEAHGCEVTIINFAREHVRTENLLKVWGKGNPLKALALLPTMKRWEHVFGQFRRENLHLTDQQYTTEKDFEHFPLDADAYCTGSDQVWNSKWNRGILPQLYLSFVPADRYKFAFSASFGRSKLDEDEVHMTKALISQYNRISVREESGLRILQDQYGYHQAAHLLDPTLCLPSEQWRGFKTASPIKEPYILIYNLNRSKEFDAYAVELAKRTGLKLVRFCTRYDQFYRPGKSMLVPEVFDFITLIDDAKYVLTDSFHATAFSMNMNTEPICVYPREFGGRIDSFLRLTSSLQRKIEDYNDFDVVNRPVDAEHVNQVLDRERKKASEWIDAVIAEIKAGNMEPGSRNEV